jgi:hypothetical protein
MPSLGRQSCIALLIIVIISLASMSVHVATHASADQQACELCSGHGNPSHAIPVAAIVFAETATALLAGTELLISHDAPRLFSYQQRGPPLVA